MIEPGSPSERGFCAKCRYSLRGLGEPRCPECGTESDPNDANTFLVADQQPMGPIAKRLYRPPGRVFLIACVLWALSAFLSGTSPGMIVPLAVLSAFSLPILTAVFVVRLTIAAVIDLWYRRTTERRKTAITWLLPPAIYVLGLILCVLNVPIFLGFAVNKPFLDRLALKATVSPGSVLNERHVGLYPIDQVVKSGTGVRIKVAGEDAGFGYFPHGLPMGGSGIEYLRLWGDWYAWWHTTVDRASPLGLP